jgi:hypothetical protein
LIQRRAAPSPGSPIELNVQASSKGAFEALMAGDGATHDAKVAAALKELSQHVDVIVLAQASMARVVDDAGGAQDKRVPILASPGIAVDYLATVFYETGSGTSESSENRKKPGSSKSELLACAVGLSGFGFRTSFGFPGFGLRSFPMNFPWQPLAVVAAVIAVALGLRFLSPSLRGYQFTAWIVAAVTAAMIYPVRSFSNGATSTCATSGPCSSSCRP